MQFGISCLLQSAHFLETRKVCHQASPGHSARPWPEVVGGVAGLLHLAAVWSKLHRWRVDSRLSTQERARKDELVGPSPGEGQSLWLHLGGLEFLLRCPTGNHWLCLWHTL